MAVSMPTILQEFLGFTHTGAHGGAGRRTICSLSPLSGNPARVSQFTPNRLIPTGLPAGRGAAFSIKAVSKGEDGPGLPAVLPSGEWPENFSILNFEDLSKHYESVLFKEEAQPSTFLADVMSKTIYTARPDQRLEEIDHFFSKISGLPVINANLECIGVLSKKDKAKASNGLNSKVEEVMSSPAITLSADKTVSDAAVLMLKNKIHRIPIVNGSRQVVGIVTRTDIFSALEGKSS
eukprot:c18189_g1_i2 orf=168-875(+)